MNKELYPILLRSKIFNTKYEKRAFGTQWKVWHFYFKQNLFLEKRTKNVRFLSGILKKRTKNVRCQKNVQKTYAGPKWSKKTYVRLKTYGLATLLTGKCEWKRRHSRKIPSDILTLESIPTRAWDRKQYFLFTATHILNCILYTPMTSFSGLAICLTIRSCHRVHNWSVN